jgi:hypothetical protein
MHIYERHAHTVQIYEKHSRNVENMKGLRIKYKGMLNMCAYSIPVYEKLLRTVGIERHAHETYWYVKDVRV